MAAAKTELDAWGGTDAVVRASVERASQATQERERKAKEAERAAARDAKALEDAASRAEVDLAWYFVQGTAEAFGFAAQDPGSGGGGSVYDNGNTEGDGAGRSFYDTRLKSTVDHLRMREPRHRAALQRWATIGDRMARMGAAERHVLRCAFTPHPRTCILLVPEPGCPDPWRRMADAFVHKTVDVPQVLEGRTVTREVTRKVPEVVTVTGEDGVARTMTTDRNVDVVETETVYDRKTSVTLTELAINAWATRSGLRTDLTKAKETPDRDERSERQAWLERQVRDRYKNRSCGKAVERVQAECAKILADAVGAYVAVVIGNQAR